MPANACRTRPKKGEAAILAGDRRYFTIYAAVEEGGQGMGRALDLGWQIHASAPMGLGAMYVTMFAPAWAAKGDAAVNETVPDLGQMDE